MIVGKFGEKDGGWTLWVLREGYNVGFWKAIRKNKKVFKSRVGFIIENGWRIKFWLDKWCSNTSLKDSFPALFVITISKDL